MDACRARRSSGVNDLDPAVNADGPILSAWGIRVNVALGRASTVVVPELGFEPAGSDARRGRA
ncbi:MAG: hypothetical protein OXG52_04110 [bacterium]|nr:hypothetical protein [bacterium]